MNNKNVKENSLNKLQTLITSLQNDSEMKMDSILEQLIDIQNSVNKIAPRKDYGEVPLFGFVDKKHEIPYVKTEYITQKFMDLLSISKSRLKHHYIWKAYKQFLKDKYNLEHIWRSVQQSNGFAVIYYNKTQSEMDEIYNAFLKTITIK